MEKARTYKHVNNEELLSGESERILHKNAKNIRIKQQLELRRRKRNNILAILFIVSVVIIFSVLIIVGGLMTR